MESKVKKGAKKTVLKREQKTIRLSGLLGDGNAQVERGRTIRMALPYGEVAVSTTCSVRATCNQDKSTVMATARTLDKIITEVLDEDVPYIEDFLKRADK
jgi:Na+-transporting NADH:ubiquinone oxidoreductase subunit NqrF